MKKGQGLLEYGLALGVFAVVAVAVMSNMAQTTKDSAAWLPEYTESFERHDASFVETSGINANNFGATNKPIGLGGS